MGSRLSEARRLFAILGFILIALSLQGPESPWMIISEGDHVHTWEVTNLENGTINETAIVDFNMDTYFNLRSVQACQTFISESNMFFFKGQVVCSDLEWDEADKNTFDTHDWSMYSEQCKPAGMATFGLLITTLIVLSLILILSTFKNIQRKCCPKLYTKQHQKAKCILPTIAFLSPLCGICALIAYFVQCIDHAAGHELVEDVSRSTSGYKGFWLALSGSVFLFIWWILFTIWFCRKRADIVDVKYSDNAGGGGMSSKLSNKLSIKKNKNKNHVQQLPQDSDDDDSEEEHSRIQLNKIDNDPPAGAWRDSD